MWKLCKYIVTTEKSFFCVWFCVVQKESDSFSGALIYQLVTESLHRRNIEIFIVLS
jgi:hypothetical protein